jgi:hypothetical protein
MHTPQQNTGLDIDHGQEVKNPDQKGPVLPD